MSAPRSRKRRSTAAPRSSAQPWAATGSDLVPTAFASRHRDVPQVNGASLFNWAAFSDSDLIKSTEEQITSCFITSAMMKHLV